LAQSFEENQTGRLEAFSDGIFAFAITLLVLGLYDPTTRGISDLLQGLLAEWPSLVALATSFLTILVMWMTHHNMFNYVTRLNRRFMFLNSLILLFITLTPFTTLIVAEHLRDLNATTATAVYAANFLLIAVAWNILWHHASDHQRLLGKSVSRMQVTAIKRQYYVGPALYALAFGLAFIDAIVSIVIIILVAAFYGITATIGK
jgi:uncharacterized membrane protein